MKELQYPFDSEWIMKKKKSLKRNLLGDGSQRIKKRIAVLGGSTTDDVIAALELFLLDAGIEPEFYQSEYRQYWQDAVFGNPELDEFGPDVVYIHTTQRNVDFMPNVRMSVEEIDAALDERFKRLEQMWQALGRFRCPIIQNNFEMPYFRLLGSRDSYDPHGLTNFTSRLNEKLNAYAQTHEGFYINDINWLAATVGLEKWADTKYWFMYKYAMSVDVIPELAYQTAAIIRSLFGKNKKCIAVDLDNTMWGGIVGDDGVEKLEIGQETGTSQAFYEFQQYVKAHKDLGIILTVCSKNEEENAIAGLKHPEGAVTPDDFTIIKANWEPKSINLENTAQELNIMPDAIVFADDNPAEREIVRQQTPCSVPEIGEVTDYIKVLDRSQFFEVTTLSADDLKRSEMYKANIQRAQAQAKFASYTDYLLSLEMTAEIGPFKDIYLARIAQLTNKSNQFNLTTLRCTQEQMAEFAASNDHITQYGKLLDKFGDNGVVSVVVGQRGSHPVTGEECLDIILWLMSCRVLKRDMELAMLDGLVKQAKAAGYTKLIGRYLPTAKNKMVKDFYPDTLGFSKLSEDSEGNTVWELDITGYEDRNHVIKV
ncbi:MAG: HAD-IIIC family phosphatase [Ruminococcus sp.]|nr:HAD-IIIC family phosphatase [Ruminococcus sp.]